MRGRFTDHLHELGAPIWQAQHEHPFVRGIGDGTLGLEKFTHWVRQDYLFLIEFARGTADFGGDAMIWSHRTHLERPRPLKEDGPIAAYRTWSERVWPEGYEQRATGEKPRSLEVLG